MLRDISLNHKGDFYCLNYLYFYRTKEQRDKDEQFCKDTKFCQIVLSAEERNTVKY